MTRYLASRFAGMAVVMLLVATLVFFITRLAPGDPAAVMLGEQATAADIAELRASYGLDKPLPVQFAYWLGELARGNLGQSIFLQRPVTQALLERAEPTLTPPQLGDGAPGWWSSPAKDAALAAFNAESDAKKRGALWGNIQSVVYTEVPYIRVGNFNSVTARSSKLDGYVAMPWPFFWNTGLLK